MTSTGRTADLSFTVTDADTAVAVGSGDLPVLGTPRLLAWCEAATCASVAADLAEGTTSVGTRVELEHLVASAVGRRVRVAAVLAHVDGRRRRFEVTAAHDDGEVVGRGVIERVVVDVERFLGRVGG